MKIVFPLIITGLITLNTSPAHANTIWNNGTPSGGTTNCDSSPDLCHGEPGNQGWTMYDDFVVSSDVTVTGMTYDSTFPNGSPSDYISSNWSIWAADPIATYVSGPLFSGNAVAVLSTDTSGTVTATQFTITGLSLDLTPGIYWLGYENVLQNDGADTVVVLSNGVAQPGYEQISDDGTTQFNYAGNTVFSIQGGAPPPPPPTPEPSGCILAGLGVVLFGARRAAQRVA